jgi:phage terminase small subunit
VSEKLLTSKQEMFAQGVASGLSQLDAYKRAYPKSLKWNPEAVRVAAYKMSVLTHISERIKEMQAVSADLAELDGAEIMREIKRVATSDIGGIIGPDGKVLMPNELDPATRAAVASFEIDEYGRVKYKFWDKNTALTNAAKIKGLFVVDNEQQKPAIITTIQLVGVKPKPTE